MRDRGSKLPGPKGGPEREEQVAMVVVAMLWWMFLMLGEMWALFNVGGACVCDGAFGDLVVSIEHLSTTITIITIIRTIMNRWRRS